MYETTILPVFCGRETRTSSSGEDKADKVFENRMFRKWRGPTERTSMARENCTMKIFMYYIGLNDQIYNNEMDGALSTYAEQKFMQEFGEETRRKETTWKN
jgi:hypothetical protein